MSKIIVNHSNYDRTIDYDHLIPTQIDHSILWLSGYHSVMNGVKANAIYNWCRERNNIEFIRFDYSGLGNSTGDFSQGTLSHWLVEALTIYSLIIGKKITIIGSSMGGWLSLLLLKKAIENQFVIPQSLLLLAPAVDFTKYVLPLHLTDNDYCSLQKHGKTVLPSHYETEGLPFYQSFLDDATNHFLLHKKDYLIQETASKISILHGDNDQDIPLSLGQKLHNTYPDSTFEILTNEDHRLSTEKAILVILNKLEDIINQKNS